MINKNNQLKYFHKRMYYGWVIVIAAFLCLMFTYGARYTFGVFFKPMSEEFGWSRTMTSGIFSLYMIFYAIGAVITGKIVDKYGPKILIISGSLLLGIGLFSCSIVSKINQLYLFYGIMVGLGSAATGWVIATTTVSRWFIVKRGITTGVTSAGIGLGSAVFVPLATLMIDLLSWRICYRIFGIMIFLVLIPLAFFMVKSPKDKNLYSDIEFEYEKIKLSLTEKECWSLEEAIRTIPFWIIFITQFIMVFQLNTLMIHFIPYVTDIGICKVEAARYISFLGLSSILGRIYGGWLSDRIGRKRIVAAAMAIQGISLFFLQMIKFGINLYIFILLYGISYGSWASQSAPLTADIFGRRYLGTLWGIITFGVGIGGAMGPLFAGWIYDRVGSYSLAFIFNSVVSILSSILLIIFVKPIKIRQKQE